MSSIVIADAQVWDGEAERPFPAAVVVERQTIAKIVRPANRRESCRANGSTVPA